MLNVKSCVLLLMTGIITSCTSTKTCRQADAPEAVLSLWNEGKAKASIINFVQSCTDKSSSRYLPPAKRVAAFDMDGTILIEKPMYVLFDFAIKKVVEKAAANPILTRKQPYKAVVNQDWNYLHENLYSEDGMFDTLLYATDGYTNRDYTQAMARFFEETRHPRYQVSPKKLVYQPVVQLINYLQSNQFDVYICSGSDPQFTRSFCTEATGVPKENVIGTTVLTKWIDGQLIRQHEFVKPLNDGPGKPVNLLNKIGKVPVITVGNSMGDFHMLEYSKTAPHSLQLLVNHDDDQREYKYKNKKMKNVCRDQGWQEISMKHDFKTVFGNLEK